jgi:hypothetical protein
LVVGAVVGLVVGLVVGAVVGFVVGLVVGAEVGLVVGTVVGALVGLVVGLVVGAEVGLVVGVVVGAEVGLVVGAPVEAEPSGMTKAKKSKSQSSPFVLEERRTWIVLASTKVEKAALPVKDRELQDQLAALVLSPAKIHVSEEGTKYSNCHT